MNAFITYDVPNYHSLLKDKLFKMGYFSGWNSNNKSYKLPKSSVWKANTTLETAYNDFMKAWREVNSENGTNIEIERLIIVPATPWVGIEGK